MEENTPALAAERYFHRNRLEKSNEEWERDAEFRLNKIYIAK